MESSNGFTERREAFSYLTKIGKLKTRTSLEISESPFSIGMEGLERKMFEPERMYENLAKLGVKWARIQSGWFRTEKVAGQYDFSWLDGVVDKLLSIGIQPWLNLGFGNCVYMPDCPLDTAWGYPPIFTECAREGWKRYIEEVALHFKDRIFHFEVWNEPNGAATYWKPLCKQDPGGYVELVKISSEALKKHIPEAVVVAGVMSSHHDFLLSLLKYDFLKYTDVVTFHVYTKEPEFNDGMYYRSLHSILKSAKPEIQIWQGEAGIPSSRKGFGALSSLPTTEDRQARWLLKRMMIDIGNGAALTSYFHCSDLLPFRGRNLPDFVKGAYYGVLNGETGTPKLSFTALQSLCTLFCDGVKKQETGWFNVLFQGTVQYSDMEEVFSGSTSEAIVARQFLFHRGDVPFLCYWSPRSVFAKVLDQTCDHLVFSFPPDLVLRDPVLVDPMTQDVYFIPPSIARAGAESYEKTNCLYNLPYLEYPLVVTNRSAIEILS